METLGERILLLLFPLLLAVALAHHMPP
jgi:hypothetical protein